MLIRNKFNGFSFDGSRRAFMGGGGGGGGQAPAPSSQSVSQTSIPVYAQPYVENMLGQTAALTDINQNPYQSYGGQRLASFTPLQNQAFDRISNQQVAGQLGTGTNLATAGGAGLLGVAGQAAGAGANYQNMATNPYAMQQYMSPYIQNALQPQLQEMQRQYGITGQQQKSQATGMGAFGGSREALMRSENERNKNMAMNRAIGEGYQNAFQQAQQAQQFGSNLGLQGQQAAISGLGQAVGAAGTLGQLGQTQYGQETGITQAQMAAGTQQQQQQQMALDIAYQDFLKQQNYPYQQQAFMSDMLRGLPMSQSAQTQYTAPPSMASQLGGLGMTATGIYGMATRAEGGPVGKGYAEGGVVGYAGGGKLESMSDEQLQAMLANPKLSLIERDRIENILALHRRMEMNPQTPQIMGGGLDTIPSGDTFEAAGGGIVAFAGTTDGSLVKTKVPPKIDSYQSFLENQIRASIENQDKVNPFEKSEALQQQYADEMKARKSTRPFELLAALGVGTMAGTSQDGLSNLGQGGVYAMQQQQKLAAEDASDRRLMLQQAVEQEKSKYGRDVGRQNAMQTALGQMYSKEIGLKNAAATAANTQAYRDQMIATKYATLWKDTLSDTKETLLKQTKFSNIYRKDPVAFNRLAEQEAKRNMPPAALEVLGKTPALMDTSGSGGGGSTVPALPPGFEIVKPK
jgi:hypothetical protein